MATERGVSSPNSYLDPYWSDLASKAATRNGVPAGLLVAVLTKGERSNADQVSEKGAKTPFQVTKEARDLVLKRDGVDAYLSDDNAADAAARILKDGINFAKGKANTEQERNALAAGFYHAGGDFKNWGPRTKAYVQRVAGSLPAATEPQSPGQQRQAPTTPQSIIARAYDAYRAGRMSPQDAAEFEADVNAGTVELPLGASLKRRVEPSADSFKVPQSVVDAYKAGKMSPQDAAEFEADMRANPGLVPEGLTIKPYKASIPGAEEYDARPTPATPTLGDQAVGLGEAALTAGTGMVGGSIGAVKGGVQGLFDPNVTNVQQLEQAVQRGAESLTYAPRTEVGQERAQQLGNVASNLIPIAPLAPQMAAIRNAGQVAKPTVQAIPQVARNTVASAAQNVAAGARAIPERVGQMMGREAPAPTPGTMGSVGAAGVDMATQRRMAAQDLPVPIELTRGQATRDFAQQRFEGETAKAPEAGAPLRERFTKQNEQLLQNMDAFFDSTGATSPELRATGVVVDKALVEQAKRDKVEVRTAYKEAEKAGELEAPVTLDSVVQHLNESAPDAATAPLLDVARKRAIKLGIAVEDAEGNLVPQPTTLKNAETFRQSINRATDYEPTNVRQSAIIKGFVDEATDGLGGNLYKEARSKRARFAQNYENRATISKLLNNKRGTTDRQVAFEDVFKHSVLDGSLDDVRNVRRILQRGGEDGQQAWKELQGQTVNYIREQATRNVARDQAGNQIISPAGLDRAIKQLDSDGKLDFVFGKQGAEQLRTINDVANHVKTVAPGAVNTSNTASVILAAMDMAISGAGGMPLPVMSGLRLVANNVKDRRLRMRVAEALGDAKRKEDAKPKPIAGVNKKRTFH